MKNRIHFVGFLLLIIQFCSTNTVFGNVVLDSNSSCSPEQTIEVQETLSTASFVFFNYGILSENVVASSQNTPSTSSKNYSEYLYKSKEAELSRINSLIKNLFYTRYVKLQFTKTDIIFPFQAFL
jgi:hypothetical protein